MDDILYIILGVAWVAWSLYSNKIKQEKKKAEKAEMERQALERRAIEAQTGTLVHQSAEYSNPVNEVPPVVVKPGRSILEEIFGDEFTIKEEAEEEIFTPEVDEKSWQNKMKDYAKVENSSLEDITEEVSADYFEKQYSQRSKPEVQVVAKKKPVEEVAFQLDELSEEFNLRKAVIYSEILRAPYVSL